MTPPGDQHDNGCRPERCSVREPPAGTGRLLDELIAAFARTGAALDDTGKVLHRLQRTWDEGFRVTIARLDVARRLVQGLAD